MASKRHVPSWWTMARQICGRETEYMKAADTCIATLAARRASIVGEPEPAMVSAQLRVEHNMQHIPGFL